MLRQLTLAVAIEDKESSDNAKGLNISVRCATLGDTFEFSESLLAPRSIVTSLVLIVDQVDQSTQESHNGPGNSKAG